jgi:uncharacterized membrane protein
MLLAWLLLVVIGVMVLLLVLSIGVWIILRRILMRMSGLALCIYRNHKQQYKKAIRFN